jgi:hypothetical protein
VNSKWCFGELEKYSYNAGRKSFNFETIGIMDKLELQGWFCVPFNGSQRSKSFVKFPLK